VNRLQAYIRVSGLIVLMTFYIVLTATIILAFFAPSNTLIILFNSCNEMGLELVLAIVSIPFVFITINEYLNLLLLNYRR